MAREIKVTCDNNCGASILQTDRADSMVGWLKRQVKDGVKKVLAEGVKEFDAAVVFHYCPECATKVSNPPLNPHVAEFIAQVQPEADRVHKKKGK